MNLIERNFEQKKPEIDQIIASSNSSEFNSTP